MNEAIAKMKDKRDKIKLYFRAYQLSMSELFESVIEYIDSLLEKDKNGYERTDTTVKGERRINYKKYKDYNSLELKYYLIDFVDFEIATIYLQVWNESRMIASCNFRNIEDEKQLKKELLQIVRKFRKEKK